LLTTCQDESENHRNPFSRGTEEKRDLREVLRDTGSDRKKKKEPEPFLLTLAPPM